MDKKKKKADKSVGNDTVEQSQEPTVEQAQEPTVEQAQEPTVEQPDAETNDAVNAELEKLRSEFDAMERQLAEAVDFARRTQADFDNYRKRNQSLRTDSLDEGFANAMKCILPTLDNFERALACETTHDDFYNGMQLIHKQLLESLMSQGLSEIDTSGMFDPNFHEAVLQTEAEDKESGSILRVMQKGYSVNNRIIRHAMVEVAK